MSKTTAAGTAALVGATIAFGMSGIAAATPTKHVGVTGVHVSSSSPVVGHGIHVTGNLSGYDEHRLQVQVRQPGGQWSTRGTFRDWAVFDHTVTFKHTGTFDVRVVAPASGAYARAASKVVTVHVKAATSAHAPVAPTYVAPVPVTSTPTAATSAVMGGPYVSGCTPDYPDFCIPYEPGNYYNCSDIPRDDFSSTGSDPYRLDADNDGIACES